MKRCRRQWRKFVRPPLILTRLPGLPADLYKLYCNSHKADSIFEVMPFSITGSKFYGWNNATLLHSLLKLVPFMASTSCHLTITSSTLSFQIFCHRLLHFNSNNKSTRETGILKFKSIPDSNDDDRLGSITQPNHFHLFTHIIRRHNWSNTD